jgi:hypothetical protein
MLRPVRPAAWLLLALAAACATDRRFVPRENHNGFGPGGEPAAVYTLMPPANGELRLWSAGARRVEVDAQETTRVHIGFELENHGQEPLRFDAEGLRLCAVATDVGQIAELQPVRVEGEPTVAAGATNRISCLFDPGAAVMPRGIAGFEVRWRVVLGDQQFAQSTPFAPWYPPDPWVYDYDWYCGWGWPYGFHYGVHFSF